jgi:hypothetical protein
VPAGAPVFVTVIVPLAAPAGTVALSFVLEEAYVTLPAGVPSKATVEEGVKPVPLIETAASRRRRCRA